MNEKWGILFVIVINTIAVSIAWIVMVVMSYGVSDLYFENHFDDNLSANEMYYNLRPEAYKANHADWLQYENKRKSHD